MKNQFSLAKETSEFVLVLQQYKLLPEPTRDTTEDLKNSTQEPVIKTTPAVYLTPPIPRSVAFFQKHPVNHVVLLVWRLTLPTGIQLLVVYTN